MAEPVAFDLKKAILYFIDGNVTAPVKLEFKMDEGTLTYTRRKNIEYRKERGLLDTVREGDQEPMDVSIEGRFSAVKSHASNVLTPIEFLEQEGAGTVLLTVGGACEPYAIDVVLEVNQDCGTTPDEIITFGEFRFEELGGDFKAGTLSVTGKCNALKPVSVHSTIP
jgi:hypothetical protein